MAVKRSANAKNRMVEQLKAAREKGKVAGTMYADTRVPVVICADTSGSMIGDPIVELNEGINQMYEELWCDSKTKNAAEVCLIGFNNLIEVEEEFDMIRNQKWCQQYPYSYQLEAEGRTYLGSAVNTALDRLEERKQYYKDNGIAYYQPWLVIMTDGDPSKEDEENLKRAIQRVRDLEAEKKLTVFCIGIGKGADMNTLKCFSKRRPPLRLAGLKFKEFFEWLSKSVACVSGSAMDEKIPLPPTSSWSDLD